MKEGDRQLGKPARLYRDTKVNVEALALVAADEGCMAYATDVDYHGAFDGTIWTWLASPPAVAGYALVSDGVDTWAADQTPAWTGKHSFAAGIAFVGASGANEVTIPDDTAIALELLDAGGLEYMRIISTNAQPLLVFNEGGADVDFRVKGVGVANALFVRGSDGVTFLDRLNVGTATTAGAGQVHASGVTPMQLIQTGTDFSTNANGVIKYDLMGDVANHNVSFRLAKGLQRYTLTATEMAYLQYGTSVDAFEIVQGFTPRLTIIAAGWIGMNIAAPTGQAHIDQSSTTAAIPVLVLDQADTSEGLINFIGSDRGAILESITAPVSIRVELGGVVYRLALYVDA